MTKYRYACYALMLGLSLWLYPLQSYSAQGCGTIKENLKAALNAGFAPVFTAVTDRAMPIIVVVNRAGDWVILGIDENENACILARGFDLQFLIERKA